MGYRHIEVSTVQSAKHGGVCGDLVRVDRAEDSTLVLCADGLGSGIKANLAATVSASRLLGLIREGFSLREAFAAIVQTMNAARLPGLPYAAFNIARFMPNGETTILTYDAPPPLLLTYHSASPLRQRVMDLEGATVGEASCFLEPGEAILLMSDGITQAGLGMGLDEGWGEKGVCHHARDLILNRTPLAELPTYIHRQARQYWAGAPGDDCTVCAALCREGREVTIFTGPPVNKRHDYAAAREFMSNSGPKVICGATTAKIVSQYLDKKLEVSTDSLNTIAPPYYSLEGVDLVTEGAVTLNQVYNILEEDPENYEAHSGVSMLSELLKNADRVNFFVGRAPNIAADDISFRQQGILPRLTIVPLLAEKLKAKGKLVVVKFA